MHVPTGLCCFCTTNFQGNFGGWWLRYLLWNCPHITWAVQDLTDDKSTLVQVMAWCRQATSQYLSQCWPRSMLPYGVTRPQWVNACVLLNIQSVTCLVTLVYLIVAWWHHMAMWICANIGPGNGLMPDSTKPSPAPILIYRQLSSVERTYLRTISQGALKNQSTKAVWK